MTDVTSFRDVPHIRILVVNRGCANSCESASRHVGFAADSELSHIPRIPVFSGVGRTGNAASRILSKLDRQTHTAGI